MRRKMLVYPLMGLTFLGCMWLIFSPSQEDREKERQGQGFNTDMPQPENAGIIGDKAKAYEQQQLEKRQKQRRGMVIIKSYHNVKYQKYLERELLKVHKNGKLYEITAIIEDEEARQKDSIDYANALKNANLMISEKNNLVNNTAKWDEEAKSVAMRFASVLAVLTMITSFVLNLFFWILK